MTHNILCIIIKIIILDRLSSWSMSCIQDLHDKIHRKVNKNKVKFSKILIKFEKLE